MNISLEMYLKVEAMKADNLDRVFKNQPPRYGYAEFMTLLPKPREENCVIYLQEKEPLVSIDSFIEGLGYSAGGTFKNASFLHARNLYDEYIKDCKEKNCAYFSMVKFFTRLTENGFQKKRTAMGWDYILYKEKKDENS